MKRVFSLSLLAVFLCISFITSAQSVVVTGRVSDQNNQPLSGVAVQVVSTKAGTTTNGEGTFTISASANASLIFTYVGYTDTTIALGGRTNLDVRLSPAGTTLSDVVVIGYGTANKRDLTGSIVKVDGKVVADKPNTNPVASLQGRVAGLSVVNSGTPGQAPDIRIRGTSSIGNVRPLYVVDGIFNDNIDYINPNDIESIEILKDPSSLAIFGVRGATGVIAITTKRARSGQTIINFNSTYGFKKLSDRIELADADEFKTLFAEERANNGVTDTFSYTGLTANTDWIDAVTRTGQFNTNNLSVSSSTDKNKFNFGLGYQLDQGIIRHEQLKKWLFSVSDEVRLSKGIRLGVNLNVSRQRSPYNATWVLDAARKVIPQISSGTQNFFVRNPYGTDSLFQDIYSGLDVGLQTAGVVNPLVQLENEWDKNINIEYRSVGSVFGEVNFLKYFSFRSTLYADISNINNRSYTPLYYAYNPKDNEPYLVSQTTRIQDIDQTYRKFQQDHVLNFKTTIGGDHNITATAGFTTYYFGFFGRTGTGTQNALGQPIPDDKRFWYVNNGFTDLTNSPATSDQNEFTTVSYLARALYNYKNKYFLNASFRDDASSRLPVQNQHQQFWAVGAAWDLTKEEFMSSQKFFNFLKIKGSIGLLGNQSASQLDGTPINYPAYPYLTTGQRAIFGTNVFSAALQAYLENPNLKWETVSAKEGGVEFNAFDNRLHFEGNYFSRTTKNLLTFVSRGSIGLKDELINGGSIRNWGTELSASWNQNFSKDFSINIAGNITFLKNKVLSLSEDLPTGYLSRAFQNNGSAESRTQVGSPIASFYGYVVEGIYQSQTDIDKWPNATQVGAIPQPGDFKFKDVNGDGEITPADRTIIGNPTPDFTYGGAISATYKGLSLSVDIVGVYGNEVFRTWSSLESPFQRVNYGADKLDRWHGPGTSNWVPILSQEHRFNYNGSSYNIEDGSYFRIRNLQLAYSFSQALLSRAKIKNLRVFANVQNLKTWKNNLGYTPEFGGDATAFGYDNAGGAIPVVSTVGINITF